MENSGKIDLSVGTGKAYLFVIMVVVPSVLVLAFVYVGIWGKTSYFTGLGQFASLPSLIPVMVLGIPFHEFLHAVGWSIFARMPIAEVKFGVLWKALTPYAHLPKPIDKYPYMAGALTPLLVMGVVPYTAGTILGHAWLVNFALTFILAAGGDLLVAWTLRKVDRDALVLDHPTRVGCIVLEGDYPL